MVKIETEEKGITLVALILTVVIMLILAAVTINVTLGEGGLIDQAQHAAEQTANAAKSEQEQLASLEQELANILAEDSQIPPPELDQTPPVISNITINEVTDSTIKITVTASDEQSGLAESNAYRYYINDEPTPREISSSNTYTYTGLNASTTYNIKVEVVNKSGLIGSKTTQATTNQSIVSETTSYVGYYADVDGDGSVDGIIYADLAIGGNGNWNGYGYTIPVSSSFKQYEITQDSYTGNFGTEPVIAPVNGSSGNGRFYVMALTNGVAGTASFWGSTGTSVVTKTNFGAGKDNTTAMISKTGSSNYLWNIITSQVAKGWYVPSEYEWAAFADAFNINSSNYSNTYGLTDYYWTSSQDNNTYAWSIDFNRGGLYSEIVNNYYCVRLGTTF